MVCRAAKRNEQGVEAVLAGMVKPMTGDTHGKARLALFLVAEGARGCWCGRFAGGLLEGVIYTMDVRVVRVVCVVRVVAVMGAGSGLR
jgi:hypothetical protein